jgi:hypothetical protein
MLTYAQESPSIDNFLEIFVQGNHHPSLGEWGVSVKHYLSL